MKSPLFPRGAAVAVALFVFSSTALAQTYEAVGTRAQGMAGAFVAVADDATATWWNPAGLATGPFFDAVLERGASQDPAAVSGAGPGRRQNVTGVAFGFPALGLSYYRLRISEIAQPTAEAAAGRQNEVVSASVRSVVLSQFGVSGGQSLGDHLVVATTAKLLRAGAAVDVTSDTGEAALDRAADLSVSSATKADMDLGAMARFGVARVGVAVKHLFEPAFGEGDQRIELSRQARAGLALLGHSPGAVRALSASFDADLTKTRTVFGDVRHVALGAEVWTFGSRVGVRGGWSRNTLGEARPSGSVGGSIAFKRGVFVEGAYTGGSDRALKGWALALRMTY